MNKCLTALENPKLLAAAVALASVAALSAAYISQYGFGLDPCALCFYQRKPYFINILLGLVAFALAPKREKTAKAVLWLAVLSFLAGSAIAAFHVGVEQHWWKGLESCSNYALPEKASPEELKKFITSRDIASCEVPAFVLFGVSMAGYNFLLSTALAVLTAYFLLRKKNAAQN